MATCQTCKYVETSWCNFPCCECKGFSKYEYKKLQTNADRIRAMSDEELAENLCDKRLTKEMWLKWLKQPAEEETR